MVAPKIPVNKGLDSSRVQVPEKWDNHWYSRHITNWLVNADIRNAIAGPGIAIDGNATSPATISLSGSVQQAAAQATTPPATKTTDYSMAAGDYFLVFNNAASTTLTLLDPTQNKGRQLTLKTIANQPVVSASANVAPLNSATPGTAILAGTAGKYATLVSDGTNWVVMQGN